MAAQFKLHIRSADKDFFEGDCLSLSVPLPDGQLGLLANHSGVAAAVSPGLLTCRLPDGSAFVAVAGGGILRFENNDALLLLDSVERPEDIDPSRARRALEEARQALAASRSPQEKLQLRQDIARARNRIQALEYLQ